MTKQNQKISKLRLISGDTPKPSLLTELIINRRFSMSGNGGECWIVDGIGENQEPVHGVGILSITKTASTTDDVHVVGTVSVGVKVVVGSNFIMQRPFGIDSLG